MRISTIIVAKNVIIGVTFTLFQIVCHQVVLCEIDDGYKNSWIGRQLFYRLEYHDFQHVLIYISPFMKH